MNLKKILTISGVVLIVIIVASIFFGKKDVEQEQIFTAEVKSGAFENVIVASGELRAENSVEIKIPDEIMRGRVRVYDIKITDLVEEGAVVDSGDYVASLDHSAIMERIEAAQTELQERYESLETAKMDTNLNLTSARNNLLTDEDDLEEKKIILEQSIYESPSVQRQAEMNLERAKRKLEQNQKAYDLTVLKSKQQIVQLNLNIQRTKQDIEEYQKIFDALRIKAPTKGMLIYVRDGQGNKRDVGTMVNRWNPTIAELPDLSSLISRTYVNEVDISRVKMGQKVEIGIDAFPEKQFTGEVVSVSNIGQSIDSKTKVFEVDIRLDEVDPLLKPAMTTSNNIYTDKLDDVLYLPLDAVFSNDSLRYVFPDKKNEKRIIRTGAENENYVVVLDGLQKGEVVRFLPPKDEDKMPWEGLDLYQQMVQEQEEAAKDSSNKM